VLTRADRGAAGRDAAALPRAGAARARATRASSCRGATRGAQRARRGARSQARTVHGLQRAVLLGYEYTRVDSWWVGHFEPKLEMVRLVNDKVTSLAISWSVTFSIETRRSAATQVRCSSDDKSCAIKTSG
jgi:hypothetical protein